MLCHVSANSVVVLQAEAADEDVTVDAAAAADTVDSTVVHKNGSALRSDGSAADEWDLTPVLQEWKPAPLFKVNLCCTWLQNVLSSTCHQQIIKFMIFAGQEHSHRQ